MPLMTAITALRAKVFDQRGWGAIADWAAVGVAASLPWSTSATAIFIVLWLLAFIATIDVAAVRRELASLAGGLPVLLWGFAALGMLWADVSWHERFSGLGGFNKLLIIPLLLVHFRRSERGSRVLIGFLASVTLLLLASWAVVLVPGLSGFSRSETQQGVLFKNYITQSTEFLICAFVLLRIAIDSSRSNLRLSLIEFGLASAFLANIFFVATGRTALVVIPVLALWLGWRRLGWKGLAGAVVICCLVAAIVWAESSYMRDRLSISATELQSYEKNDADSSTGLHLEFLRKSLSFVQAAPIFGHGTGSIPEQFRNAAHDPGSAGISAVNPHNQMFGVAIQLGLVGAAVLVAMWLAHFRLFFSSSLTAWAGTVVVVQNVVSSLFNSHLFDFTEGWIYVFGVGVIGGMVLRERDGRPAPQPKAEP
jgi:O-antigen ligase